LATALELEQGGGGFLPAAARMLQIAVDWAKGAQRGGRAMIEDPVTLSRLARAAVNVEIGEVLHRRSLWETTHRVHDKAYGPMSKLFTTEAFIADANDLLALVGPEALVRDKRALSFLELSYRHSTATTIYGGTSEVLRSLIAERALGLPRSRG